MRQFAFEDQFLFQTLKCEKDTFLKRENLRECDIFRTQIGFNLGWPCLAQSACPFPGDTVAKESYSNGLQGVLPVIP